MICRIFSYIYFCSYNYKGFWRRVEVREVVALVDLLTTDDGLLSLRVDYLCVYCCVESIFYTDGVFLMLLLS